MKGNENHNNSDSDKFNSGDIKKIIKFDLFKINISFLNNLIASLKGWVIPVIIDLFGPLRSWI